MDNVFSSVYRIRLTSADTGTFIAALQDAHVRLFDIAIIDELNVEFSIRSKDFKNFRSVANKRNAEFVIDKSSGLIRIYKSLSNRVALFAGVLLMMILTIYLPTRILFVFVEGNCVVNDKTIIEAGEKCGVYFGANRSHLRSEEIKNEILQLVPQLKWVGVNTKGCIATITVKERANTELLDMYGTCASSIYAKRDGVISSITVTKGVQLCVPGQAVKEKQLLVSGYSEYGKVVLAGEAEAEIFAITLRDMYAIEPEMCPIISEHTKRISKWHVEIGKKQINLYIGSGNSDGVCGKIKERIYLTLPGGFRLPMCFVKNTVISYLPDADVAYESKAKTLAKNYMLADMVAGKILSDNCSVTPMEGLNTVRGSYVCHESIGKLQYEEIR